MDEMIVKEANPWTVMCSYNRLNEIYASENYHLLTELLRDERMAISPSYAREWIASINLGKTNASRMH